MIEHGKQDFIDFKKHALKWQRTLGLTEWEIKFYHKTVEETNAESRPNITSRQAYLTLSKLKEKEVDIEFLALHEMLHVMFANMTYYAREMIKEDIVGEEEHMIINKLTHALLNSNRV